LTAFEVAVQLELKKLLGHFPVAIAARVIGPPPPPLEVKFAVTDFGAFMVRFWGVVVPVRSPLKPENVNPLFAVALTETAAPLVYQPLAGLIVPPVLALVVR
jgi:hypothetical protein